MVRTLNQFHKDAINLRKAQAHMYAAGWNDAVQAIGSPYPKHSKVDELGFSRYYEELALAYYRQETHYLASIPAAFESYSGNSLNAKAQ